MRSTYKYLAYLICGLVMLQAASHAWVSSGITKYLEDGGTIDFQSSSLPDFPEASGFIIHGMNGMFVIPLVSLILLGIAFAAKVPGAVMWAAVIVGLVALQVALGLMGHSISALAFLHGVNALILFGAAMFAAGRVRAESAAPAVGTHAAARAG